MFNSFSPFGFKKQNHPTLEPQIFLKVSFQDLDLSPPERTPETRITKANSHKYWLNISKFELFKMGIVFNSTIPSDYLYSYDLKNSSYSRTKKPEGFSKDSKINLTSFKIGDSQNQQILVVFGGERDTLCFKKSFNN